jgi:lysozyme
VDLPDYRRIIDDIEAGNRHYNMDGVMMDIRDGYPATERIYGGKGSVKLSREWMIYVNRINGIDGCKYQFVDFENYPTCHIFKPNVGWHNKGYDNLIEQLTFAGNIVDVISIEGDRAYIRSFYNDQMPPAPIWPDKDHLDPKVQLFTTQFKTKLDVTTNGKYPRTLIIANPGERLWIDVANLRPIALVIPPENEVDMYVEGIDTSHWESVIQWDKVATSKKFVWCKATESYTYKDPEYKADIQAAKAAGMLVGSYHFFRWAGDTLRQTRLFLDTIKGMPMDLPPMLDVEEEKIGYGWKNYQTALKLCLDTIEGETGRKPVIYTSQYYWGFTNNPVWAKDYPLCVANYTTGSTPVLPIGWDRWTFWQYSAAGKIYGIPYDGVDLDHFNGSYLDLLQFCKIETIPPIVTEPTDAEKLKRLWDAHTELH